MILDLDEKLSPRTTKHIRRFLDVNEISIEEFVVSFISIITAWAKSSEMSMDDFRLILKTIEHASLEIMHTK